MFPGWGESRLAPMLTTASHAPHVYIQCDVPAGMTLVEWRRAHSTPKRRRRLRLPRPSRSTS
jgi:hypothetical protein